MDWEPIDKAPKDGRLILLAKDGFIEIGRRIHGEQNKYYGHTREAHFLPSHWMRLPIAPRESDQ